MRKLIQGQNILGKNHHIQSPAALFLLKRKYRSVEYYLRWERNRKAYLSTQEMKCHYCKRDDLLMKTNDEERLATIDHVVPRAKGGLDDPSNYVVACLPCNQRKGSKDYLFS